jgi:hypothetical protein
LHKPSLSFRSPAVHVKESLWAAFYHSKESDSVIKCRKFDGKYSLRKKILNAEYAFDEILFESMRTSLIWLSQANFSKLIVDLIGSLFFFVVFFVASLYCLVALAELSVGSTAFRFFGVVKGL